MARAIYYDTETTGLKADKDRIVEIAAFDPVRDKTFVSFVNPGIPIPPDASAIHRITNEMVADAPSFDKVAKEFVSFCEGDVVLVAHNNDSFDYHFLKHEFERHSVEMPAWKFLDSLKWARRYRPDLPKHTLQFLREIASIPANDAHRALDDVIVLHQVFQTLIDDLSIDDVFTLLNRQRKIEHMPFGKHQGMPLQQLPASYVQWLASSGALDKPENGPLKERLAQLGKL